MAELGVSTYDDLVGQVELLEPAADAARKARGARPDGPARAPEPPQDRRAATTGRRRRSSRLASTTASCCPRRAARSSAASRSALGPPIATSTAPSAALLSSEIVRRHGPEGLPEGTIEVDLTGSAGPELRRLARARRDHHLAGDVNDYAGKGLSGGILAVRPPAERAFEAERT